MQSEIKNKARARQIIDFKGIRLGEKEKPTDCDGLIEWHNLLSRQVISRQLFPQGFN
ncbi:MAG: hypothetical protein IJL14_10090 [Selenomonadaceae bacterium]|nr:hypothetical protein [Selenomonadaceae bacterium]